MIVESINAKQATGILADMAKGIKPQEADIVRTAGDNMITDNIRDVVYSCKNANGDYYWQKVYKDGVVIRQMVSISAGEICKSMNRWMRANKI